MISDFWDLTSLTGHIYGCDWHRKHPTMGQHWKKNRNWCTLPRKSRKSAIKSKIIRWNLPRKLWYLPPCTQRNLGTSEFISGGVVERQTFRSCDLSGQPSRLSACTRVEIGSWYHLRWEHCGCTGCAACKHSPCCEWLNPALVGPALNELKTAMCCSMLQKS